MSAETVTFGQGAVELLLARIDALQALLVVYRTGSRPTEKLFARLERTKRSEDLIRGALDVNEPQS